MFMFQTGSPLITSQARAAATTYPALLASSTRQTTRTATPPTSTARGSSMHQKISKFSSDSWTWTLAPVVSPSEVFFVSSV